ARGTPASPARPQQQQKWHQGDQLQPKAANLEREHLPRWTSVAGGHVLYPPRSPRSLRSGTQAREPPSAHNRRSRGEGTPPSGSSPGGWPVRKRKPVSTSCKLGPQAIG